MERRGKKSVAQTPAPKKDRIYGSKRNPKGSASSSKSASKIELSESIINTLENKRDEYNAKHPSGKVTLATLKAVFRRGAGAYSSSHRPTITGGRPNSRSAWAFARVNKFLLKKGGTKVKAAYVQDDDLMAKGGVILGEEYNGKDVKKYLGNANYKEDSFFQYIKNTDKYILDNVDIHSVVMRDSSLFDFINQYKDTLRANENEWEWDNKFPIVIGDNAYDKNIVLDGYHRITQAIVNNENEILAFVKKKKYEEGGLIAPNGKVSNLTHEQWHLVRTPEFKAWFGDWERLATLKIKDSGIDDVTLNNISKDISKVVDENGEPLVVYHGTNIDFTIFKLEKPTIAAYGRGFYFTNNKDFAKNYARGENAKILNLFLNVRKIFEIYEDELPIEYEKYSDMANNKGLSRDFTNKLITQEYDGVYAKNKYSENEIVVFNPEQIKLADGTNTTFDAENPDIRYEEGGLTDSLRMAMGNLKKNGIVLKDKNETITLIAYNTGNQERKPSLYNKSLIYKSVQPIKSANEIIQNFDLQDFEMFSEGKIEEYKKSHLIILNQNEVVYDSSVLAEGGDLGQELTPILEWIKTESTEEDGSKRIYNSTEFYLWIYNDIDAEKKLKEGIYEYAYPTIDFGNNLELIWTNFNQYKGSKRIVGFVIGSVGKSGVTTKLDNGFYSWQWDGGYNSMEIGIMTTKPLFRRKGVNEFAIKYLRNIFNLKKEQVDFYNPTEQGSLFISSKKYEEGGDLGQEITCVNCGWHWNTNNSNEFDKYVCHKCGFDNRTYYDSNPIGYADGGLIAPNGKKSNLTTEQYNLVRTPKFKAWFGDWENDPENASKVVDENGEPLVVYRTTKKEDYHNNFLKNKYVFGIYFSEDIKSTKIYGQFTKEYFLNIKNPKLLRGIDYDEMWIYSILTKDKYKNLKDNNYDGAIWKTKNVFYELVVFEPTQIKLADGSNTTFDANNPDIRYKNGGNIENEFDDLDNNQLVKTLKSFYSDISESPIFQYLDLKVGDYTLNIGDNEFVIFKKKPFSKIEAIKIGRFIQPYFDASKKPLFARFFDSYTVSGNNIIIKVKDMYEHGGLLKKAPSLLKIADKHNVDLETVTQALKNGIKVEMEHTKNKNVAKTIASHHLYESPKYYEKLKVMEKELNLDEHYEDIRKIYNIGGVVDPVLSFSTPTGEPSKLTYLQQILVRTDAFKKFFGDWEYAGNQFVKNGRQEYEYLYRNVSKVIDKITLEPKVVYHGTRVDSEFYVFDVSQQSGLGRPYGYFAHNMEYSENFTSPQMGITNGQPFLYKCFVNIRNPFYAMTSEYYDIQEDAQYWKNEISKTIALDKYTNELDANKLKTIKDVVESQIGKYIDDTFRSSEASFWVLMARDNKKLFKYFLNNYRYDGVFYAEEFSNNYNVDNPAEFTEAVTIFEPMQVKLADGRNLNFDPMNVDIRYAKGGDTDNVENTEEKYNNMGKRENLRNLLLGDKYAEGGEVVANKLKDGNDGKKGGYFEGRSHAEGGIKAYNKDTGQMIEVEGEEVIITKGAVKDPQKREFEGEMLTNREILSRINQSGGGVSFARGGETGASSCGCSGKKYKYGGEMMDDYSIVRIMNRPFEIINDNFADARAFADMLVNKLK